MTRHERQDFKCLFPVTGSEADAVHGVFPEEYAILKSEEKWLYDAETRRMCHTSLSDDPSEAESRARDRVFDELAYIATV